MSLILAALFALQPALAIEIGAGAKPGWVREGSPHYDLEQLYSAGKMKEGLAVSKDRLATNPDDADLYWMVGRFMFEIAEGVKRDDPSMDKVAYYTQMREILEEGLRRHPGHPHIAFAHGISMGRLGTTRGVLSSLFLAEDVEDAWLLAANSDLRYASINGEEQLPCDAMLTLGIFYRLVPDSWLVQMIAGTRGNLKKSVDYLERSKRCSPNRIGTLKELGVSLVCRGQQEKNTQYIELGRASLLRARSLPPISAGDRIDLKDSVMLLQNDKLACGYSRDGQQDLDESKLEEPGVQAR